MGRPAKREDRRGFSPVPSNEMFQSLVACAPVGIFLTDRDGFCTYVSERCQAICGFSFEEALGQGWRDFVHAEDAARVMQLWTRCVKEERDYEMECRMGRNEYRCVLVRSTGMIGAGGCVIGRSGTVEDLTDRKRTEAALRESAQRHRSVIEALHDGIVFLDCEARIIACNASACRILGLTEDEFLGRTPFDPTWQMIHEDGKPFPAETLPGVVAARTGRSCSDVVVGVHRPDGSLFWALVNAQPLFPPGSVQAEGAVVSFADITERRESERTLRRLSGRLLRLQDEERRRIARELHDSTGQALAALAMNLELIAREAKGLPKAARRALAESQTLAEQSSREVRSMASLLHPPLLDEIGLASAVRWFCDGVSARTGLEIDLALPARLQRLGRDLETTVFRIVQEGLTNVHRHSGSLRATVRVSRSDGHLVLEVGDSGRGLPPSVLDHRRRADQTVVGIGIPGMRERVRQLGGQLEIRSGAQGTLLRAVLPLKASRA